jgi:acetyl-CoA carboxylase carboxyltransferase component
VNSALQGTIVSLEASPGDEVRAGQLLLVMEAMKMQHEVVAPTSGRVLRFTVEVGDAIYEGEPLAYLEPGEIEGAGEVVEEELDLDLIRPDLAEVERRRSYTRDDAPDRQEAAAKRHERGLRTARENIEDLCDPGTFIEYGALVVPHGPGQPVDDLARKYPADGMVNGIGAVNGALFGDPASRCVVMSYDYTVLAGTQGGLNHRKTDRILDVARDWTLPVVIFTEGGGGRAGGPGASSSGFRIGGPLDTPTWNRLGRLSGLVPLVGVNSGFSFAGNAALLGMCDVVIATQNSSIGMGGPAMIEGGNLGVFRPEEVGPMSVQVPNGVVDIAVADEVEAVAKAKQYLSYFQGTLPTWEAHDQRALRHAVPENRLRVYDIRRVVETLGDVGTVLELRPEFGKGMITALMRIEGRPVGLIANNPAHQSGAIESDGADKASRFMQLCDAFDLPIVSLCDTPGIMVGPEAEKTALVRHSARMFVIGANVTVPLITIVLRKAYGLGAMTMGAGSFKSTAMAVSWPTGEFGGMGLEGQVKLGFRAQLAAIEDPAERMRRYEELVAEAYERGKALNAGVSFGVDDVIDPADTRSLISSMLASTRYPVRRHGEKKVPYVDTW